MNTHPLLSVIVPVKDTPLEYLKECLTSVLNQSYKELIELIIVESNSMPNYKVKLEHLIDKINFDVPVKLEYLNPDFNLPKARNYGVNLASGEYVLFLDSDDYLDPQTAEKSIQKFNDDAVLIYTNHVSCFRQVTYFFLNIFTDGVFAGKHSLPETKHYCKNSSLFI